jgi:hypothetical protein
MCVRRWCVGACVVQCCVLCGGCSSGCQIHSLSFTSSLRRLLGVWPEYTANMQYIMHPPALHHAPLPALRPHQPHALVLASHHICMAHRLALLSLVSPWIWQRTSVLPGCAVLYCRCFLIPGLSELLACHGIASLRALRKCTACIG